jgi:hypothetical protein
MHLGNAHHPTVAQGVEHWRCLPSGQPEAMTWLFQSIRNLYYSSVCVLFPAERVPHAVGAC